MAHFATTATRKVADVGSIKPLEQSDLPRASLKSQIAWKSEIAGRIIPIPNDVEEFLEHFVPGRKPGRPQSSTCLTTLNSSVSCTTLSGLTALVDGFASKAKLTLHDHEHARIKLPYALCESENHITQPDVVALPPGETLLGSSEDRWRNICFVIEAKLKESEDPMRSYSKAHENTLIQRLRVRATSSFRRAGCSSRR
ncbi:hypothetical protein DAEQUDRAFT_789378 [Daedalea quercina L-15889]|uniref:Fungal-type protein kinase domain-containing protein n=1 Tax=Daedalea quercina L-15889 TaxID=1314783 RepID=A0A165KE00_9APHY|nr:hypothetical protein DAEQUDRAFT_789378 [Daedalea quercina L-15889]